MILRAYGNFCQNRKDQNFLDVRYGQKEFPKVAGIFTLVESSNQLFDFFGVDCTKWALSSDIRIVSEMHLRIFLLISTTKF